MKRFVNGSDSLFIKNLRSLCGREDGIIAGFSSPHLERDGITFPRCLIFSQPARPKRGISISRRDAFAAFLTGICGVICVGVAMPPQHLGPPEER